MPWSPKDAKGHTGQADHPVLQRQWAHVANEALKRGLSDTEAIMEANAVVRKTRENMMKKMKKKMKK